MTQKTRKTHITLSIPRKLYVEMKKHKEIKWSEIARRSIEEKVSELKGITKGSELLKRMDPETRELFEKTSKMSWKRHYKKMREKTRKKAKSLMQVS